MRSSSRARRSRATIRGMPSKDAKQHRLMAAVAHDPQVAEERGIPQSVGEEYVAADKRKAALRRLAAKRRAAS